jgi:hypothetical protein
MIRAAGLRLSAGKDLGRFSWREVLSLCAVGILCWGVGAAKLSAATYYVDAANGRDSNPGTAALPKKTVVATASSAADGDTIIIVKADPEAFTSRWPDHVLYQAKLLRQTEITWTFQDYHSVGQFANGDLWVVGPVTIVAIEPRSVSNNGRIANGSMVNPSPRNGKQGYDNAMSNNVYDPSLNVAYDVSPTKPLVLQPGSSLASTVSVEAGGALPQLKRAVVLTVLSSAPLAGSFRPPYSGTDKTIKFNKSSLNYSLLKQLTPVPGTPDLATVEAQFATPWLDHGGGWSARFMHPQLNMPDYGRDIAAQIGIGALMLHLNFTPQQKERLLCSYVQLGIDLYGIVADGGTWNWANDGGHAGGRKWPILFAGIMLNDPNMKSIGLKSGDYLYANGHGPGNPPSDYIHFGEDDQTFYVSQLDVDVTHSSSWGPDSRDAQRIPYEVSDIGLPEWGIRHATEPGRSNKWLPTEYRGVAGPPFNGLALPALLMNAKALWNHDAFFDYTDRYMAFTAPGGEYEGYWRSSSIFTSRMWDFYRAQYGPVWSATRAGHAPQLAMIGDRQVLAGQTLTITLSATDADGDALSYQATSLPEGATFSRQTFTWTPTLKQVGAHQVTFEVSDGQYQDSETITITVTRSNTAPSLQTIGDKTVRENELLTFSIHATDAEDDPITYSATHLPNGASFSGQTFRWTPSYSQAGTYTVTFTASDGNAQNSLAVTIEVVNVNRVPTLSPIGTQSVEAGMSLTLNLSATDPDGDALTFSADPLPNGANLTGSTLTWTPTVAQIGFYDIRFGVTDGTAQDSETVTIAVTSNVSDTTAPEVTKQSPKPDAIQVPLNNLVTLSIADLGTGIDPASTVIQVDDEIVYQGDVDFYNSSKGRCWRAGQKHLYRFTYQADNLFDLDHAVTVNVNATDLAGNTMSPYTYSFMTEMQTFGVNQRVSIDTEGQPHNKAVTVSDTAGDVWVFWHAGQEGQRRVFAACMAAGADSFTTPVRLATNESDQCNPDVALGSDGRLYAVWQDNQRGNWDIYMSISTDGVQWSRPVLVSDSDKNETLPAIAVDGSASARVYVAWQDDRNGQADIYVADSSNAFSQRTVSRVTTNEADQLDPDIVIDAANVVTIVWTDERNGAPDLYGASSSSGNWANVPLVTKAGIQTNPALAADPAGSRLHLLWVDESSGNQDVCYASFDQWPPEPLVGASVADDTANANQTAPIIVCSSQSRVFACWQDFRYALLPSGDSDLFVTELVSDGAKTNVLVGDDGTNSNQSEPALGIDTHGNPYAVWTDDRDGQSEIYYAATTFIDPHPLDAKLVEADVGATIGTEPSAIESPDDVSIVVPPNAVQEDIRISISKIVNPKASPVASVGSYEFGPSGVDFSQAVTVTIPYRLSDSTSRAKPYWYDALTGAFSQQGITDVEDVAISPTLRALRFKTTHFTPYYVLPGDTGRANGTIAGGCSISASGGGSPLDLLIPYVIVSATMVFLRRRDRKRRPSSDGILESSDGKAM